MPFLQNSDAHLEVGQTERASFQFINECRTSTSTEGTCSPRQLLAQTGNKWVFTLLHQVLTLLYRDFTLFHQIFAVLYKASKRIKLHKN